MEAQPQLVDGCSQPQQRDLAVEVEADYLQLAGRHATPIRDAEPDLVEVDRPEGPLDGQEPRAVTRPRSQADLDAGSVVLDRNRRAELGPRRRAAAARVA